MQRNLPKGQRKSKRCSRAGVLSDKMLPPRAAMIVRKGQSQPVALAAVRNGVFPGGENISKTFSFASSGITGAVIAYPNYRRFPPRRSGKRHCATWQACI